MSYGKIMDALRKAGFVNENGDLNKYNMDELYIEDFLGDLFFEQKEYIEYQIDTMDVFNSPGYSCSTLAVSWVDAKGLHMEMFLLIEN